MGRPNHAPAVPSRPAIPRRLAAGLGRRSPQPRGDALPPARPGRPRLAGPPASRPRPARAQTMTARAGTRPAAGPREARTTK